MPSHKNKDLKNRPPRGVREAQEKADPQAGKRNGSAPPLADPPVEDGASSNGNLPNPVLLDLVCTFLRYNSLGATATSLEKETQRREAKILKNNSSSPAWKGAAEGYPSLASITTQWAKEHPESPEAQKAGAAATKVESKNDGAEDSSDVESDDDSSRESSSEEDSDEDMEDAQEVPVASFKRKAEDSSDSESSEDSSDDSSDEEVAPVAKKQRVSSPESSSEEESDDSGEDEEKGVSVKPTLTMATTESGAEADEDEEGSTVKAAVNTPLPDSDDDSDDGTSSEEDSDEKSEDSELEAAANPETGVLDVEAEETSDDDGDDDEDDDESEDSEDSDDESEESENSVSEDGGAPVASTRATSVDKDEAEDDDDSSDSSISSSDSDDDDAEDDEENTQPTKDVDDHNSTDSSKTLQATSPTFAPKKDAATLVKELEAMEEPTSGIHPDRLNQMSGFQKPNTNTANSNIKRKRESLDASTTNGTPGSKFQKKQNVPFSRIDRNAAIDPRFADNSYQSYDYADKAHRDLIVTKGKGFTKEKNKKKRGSYKGGYIDDTPRGIKFDD